MLKLQLKDKNSLDPWILQCLANFPQPVNARLGNKAVWIGGNYLHSTGPRIFFKLFLKICTWTSGTGTLCTCTKYITSSNQVLSMQWTCTWALYIMYRLLEQVFWYEDRLKYAQYAHFENCAYCCTVWTRLFLVHIMRGSVKRAPHRLAWLVLRPRFYLVLENYPSPHETAAAS